MVSDYEVEFADKVRVYVTGVYPSIHLYTVDEAMINWCRRKFDARTANHRSTVDVIISTKKGLRDASSILIQVANPKNVEKARLLMLYTAEGVKKEARDQLARQIAAQGHAYGSGSSPQ